jgi:hypothetical protein
VNDEPIDTLDTAAAFVALALLPLLMAARAAVLMVLWGWFVVPLGVPALGFWGAAGMVLVVDVARAYSPRPKGEPKRTNVEACLLVLGSFAVLGVSLAVGAVVHMIDQSSGAAEIIEVPNE